MHEKGGDLCKKCGRCCYFKVNHKWLRCKYLDKNNLCKIYKNRIGTVIYKGFICDYRIKQKRIIKDCPYNIYIYK